MIELTFDVAGGTSNIPDSGYFSLSRDDMPTLQFNMNYADPSAVRVGPTIYGAGYSKIPHIEDELKSFKYYPVLNLGLTVGF